MIAAPEIGKNDFYTSENRDLNEIDENEEEKSTAQTDEPEDGDNRTENQVLPRFTRRLQKSLERFPINMSIR